MPDDTIEVDRQRVEPDTDRAVRIAQELEEAGQDPERPAAGFLADLPYSLRRAVINDLNGEGWGTVESRRHDDLCACDDCRAEAPTTA